MIIETHKPELEALIQEQLQSGAFHDVEELLIKALHALTEASATATSSQPRKRLIDVLRSAPFAGSELKIERQKDPAERAKSFRQWAEGHKDHVVLPDEAMTRASFYEDRE